MPQETIRLTALTLSSNIPFRKFKAPVHFWQIALVTAKQTELACDTAFSNLRWMLNPDAKALATILP